MSLDVNVNSVVGLADLNNNNKCCVLVKSGGNKESKERVKFDSYYSGALEYSPKCFQFIKKLSLNLHPNGSSPHKLASGLVGSSWLLL